MKTQKQRKFSTVCYNNSSDREALITQEVKTQDISSNQEKSLPKEKGALIEATSSTNRCKEEFPTTKQSNFSGMPNLVCQLLTSYIFLLFFVGHYYNSQGAHHLLAVMI